jgi:lipoprotein-anchoring transpeptidase ErfK/SrfK
MPVTRDGRRRAAALLIPLVVVLSLVLSACSSAGTVTVTVTTTPGKAVTVPGDSTSGGAAQTGTAAGGSGAQATAPTRSAVSSSVPAMRYQTDPDFGSKNVAPTRPFTLTVFSAVLTKVTMTGDDGTIITGKLSADNRSWNTSERLKYGTTYTVVGTTTTANGANTTINGTFSTIKPASTLRASFQREIANGATVGVAAPIIITFSGPVADKAAAEKTLSVTTDKGTIAGSWGWLQDEDYNGDGVKESAVHFRPNAYWPGHTKVHVAANLYGVNYGNNSWGREDIAADFTIGRSQIVKADVSSFRMVVIVDDVITKNYPVSYGKMSEPGRQTVSGIHVVTEKFPTFKMTNPQFGYYNVPEKWAVRINNNGEFIHENAGVEKAGYLGKQNVSHGCINMSGKDAEDYYKSALYGDPVEVTGTGVPMTPADWIYDWIYTPDQWKSLSALG